jgi:hypothetical protein
MTRMTAVDFTTIYFFYCIYEEQPFQPHHRLFFCKSIGTPVALSCGRSCEATYLWQRRFGLDITRGR